MSILSKKFIALLKQIDFGVYAADYNALNFITVAGQRYLIYSEAVINLTTSEEDEQAQAVMCSSMLDSAPSLQISDSHSVSPICSTKEPMP